ncbi:MAG: hypothetical protein KTR16_11390 [Acidiferrobacterales bacterium]|nr:hypothetical protein [Acidiferrobacterales bacterium]
MTDALYLILAVGGLCALMLLGMIGTAGIVWVTQGKQAAKKFIREEFLG